MSKIRGTNTKPEILVRSMIHRLGYRFRLHRKELPGTPDLVFPSRKKVIFVNGFEVGWSGARVYTRFDANREA